jgi:hypothetical protein
MRRTPLHVARPIARSPSDEVDDGANEFEVIDSYEKAYGNLVLARELWRLVGRADRAEAVEDVILDAHDYKPPRLDREHIVALRDALDGLEAALVGPVIDEDHLLSMDKVNELRGRPEILDLHEIMDLDESRGELARYAVQEALIYVDNLRRIVDQALAEDALILFD